MPIFRLQLASEAVLLFASRRSQFFVLVIALVAPLVVFTDVAPADAGTPTCDGLAATMVVPPGGKVFNGTNGDDVIVGTDGADVIRGGDGRDVICGGSGDDDIRGERGSDWIFGNQGNDTLDGNKGHDRIYAGQGNDSMDGGPGNDRLKGKSGNDDAHGDMGADVCIAEAEANCEMDFRWGHDKGDWRDLVDEYFGDIAGGTDTALCILHKESGSEPFIVGGRNNNYFGLFQHSIKYWNARSRGAGFEGESPFHPEANIAAARWLSDRWLAERGDRWSAWTVWKSCT